MNNETQHEMRTLPETLAQCYGSIEPLRLEILQHYPPADVMGVEALMLEEVSTDESGYIRCRLLGQCSSLDELKTKFHYVQTGELRL